MKDQQTKSKARRRDGFTLMELMLVLVILGIIAGIAGPMLLNTRDQANIDATKSAVSSIEGVITSYTMHHNALPTSLKDLYEKPADIQHPNIWVVYIDKEKLKDPWGREYHYEATAQNNSKRFKIWSDGPTVGDQSDDIGNWVNEQD